MLRSAVNRQDRAFPACPLLRRGDSKAAGVVASDHESTSVVRDAVVPFMALVELLDERKSVGESSAIA